MPAIFDQGARPPCPHPFNLAHYVLTHAQADPNKTALSVLGTKNRKDWSYARLTQAVQAVAAGLQAQGLQAGDRILMRLGNTVDFPLAFLGAIWAGCVPVPTSSQLSGVETAEMIAQLCPALILRDPVISCPDTHVRVLGLDDLKSDTHAIAPPVLMDPDTPAYIIFTSGTSGTPRGVVHAHRAVWARRMMWDGWYDLRDSDRLLHAGAFNWTYTLGTGLLDPWACGATALVAEPGTPIAALPGLLADHRATLLAATPGVYRKLLSRPGLPDMNALRHGLSAGEKLPQRISEKWHHRTGTNIYEAFGMSECSTFISRHPGQDTGAEVLGTPQNGRRVAILGPDGPVAHNVPGTIAIASSDPGLMIGYLDAAPATGDAWFLTGDQGVMRPNGEIGYIGRTDDILTTGGYRIAPLEIETALLGYEGIAEVAVTEIEIKADTKVIAALYTAAKPLDEDAFRAYADTCLASYKTPRVYRHIDILPRTPNGKLQRAKLAALFEAENGTT